MQYTIPQMASLLQLVGDVIPFGKRSMFPNLGTEGAGRVGNTRGEVIDSQQRFMNQGGEAPLNDWLYQRGVPMHQIGKTLETQKQYGLTNDAIKYERLMWEQQKAKEQAVLDKQNGISQELRDAFMKASRSQPENQD